MLKLTARSLLWCKAALHLGAVTPLIWLAWALFAGHLGGDPTQAVIQFLGKGALQLLLITLCISPLARLLKLGMLIRVRRLVGLWCFTYAAAHVASWLLLDLQLDWSLIGSELVERSYILLGMVALLILLALAMTSFTRVQRRMGPAWQRLHNLIYLAVLLVPIHYWWSVKSGVLEPAIYLGISLALLWWRRQKIARWLAPWMRQRGIPRKSSQRLS